MLNLHSQRLDYGEQLRAFDGYELDLGVATTFSLDLETLVAASLSLGLDLTLEGDLRGERLAFLECLDKLQKRLLVFYQRGNLKVPENFNRLFSLLEPLLVPTVALPAVDSKAAFASFHPKVWLLRFTPLEAGLPVRMRLLVLSRNLTFDRSWDIGVCIDGVVTQKTTNVNAKLVAFFNALCSNNAHQQVIDSLCASLSSVQWDNPERFSEMEMLPGRPSIGGAPAAVPLDLEGRIDELLVVSPFVDADKHSLLVEC
ncbi:hypothetical protein J7U46_09110 [Pelomonas sp. V22]|uniref:hypothetical protein n=1 Tax=Pelomonas sp. V22 TaxID=2822139 RepID=UPI0024A9E8ED|nr:hypothetical protein [Pelomonas sp. V22]MDI4633203.1 hypothetical protein [Pelomonas sp. V22]